MIEFDFILYSLLALLIIFFSMGGIIFLFFTIGIFIFRIKNESKLFFLKFGSIATVITIVLFSIFLALNPFKIMFTTSYIVENNSGEDVWVLPYGTQNNFEITQIQLEQFVQKDNSKKFTFDYDDQMLTYFIITNKNGLTCKLIASKYYGQNSCCYPPEKEIYSIPPLESLNCL